LDRLKHCSSFIEAEATKKEGNGNDLQKSLEVVRMATIDSAYTVLFRLN